MQTINTTSVNKTLVIGKAKTMYTLYECVTDGVKSNYAFVKILSKDLNKVKAIYPNLKVDETLHGKFVERIASLTEPKNIQVKVLGFKFNSGKYVGMLVSEVNDPNYLCYVYNNGYFSNISVAIKERALELGAIDILGKIYIKNTKSYFAAMNIYNLVTNNEAFNFAAKCNLNELGEIKDFDSQFTFIFNNCKFTAYSTLPIDEFGKAKKIKGKEIRITKGKIEYHDGVSNLFIIESFHIIK